MTQGLATLVTLLAFCVEGAEFSMAPRSSLCIRSACVAAAEGGENCDKRNVFDKRNVVESMGCRGGGKILIKGMCLIKGM